MKRLLPLLGLYLALPLLLLPAGYYPALQTVCAPLPLLLTAYVATRWSEPPAIVFGLAAAVTRFALDGEPWSLALLLLPAAGWGIAVLSGELDLTIPGLTAALILLFALPMLPLETLLANGDLPRPDSGMILQPVCAALIAEFAFPRLDRLFATPRGARLRRYSLHGPAEHR